jgi:hypothetical protein
VWVLVPSDDKLVSQACLYLIRSLYNSCLILCLRVYADCMIHTQTFITSIFEKEMPIDSHCWWFACWCNIYTLHMQSWYFLYVKYFCKSKRYLWPAHGEYIILPQEVCKTRFVVNYELKKLMYFKSYADVTEKNGVYKQVTYSRCHLHVYRSHSGNDNISTRTSVRLLSIDSTSLRKYMAQILLLPSESIKTSNICHTMRISYVDQ